MDNEELVQSELELGLPETDSDPIGEWKDHPVAKDCIDLDTSLCKWLGERLIFLSTHGHSYPVGHTKESWCKLLKDYGEDLKNFADFYLDAEETLLDGPESEVQRLQEAAKEALTWVAKMLGHLWD